MGPPEKCNTPCFYVLRTRTNYESLLAVIMTHTNPSPRPNPSLNLNPNCAIITSKV